MPEFHAQMPVVLTGTIIPNVAGAVSLTPEARLAEYRHVVQSCQQFAPVIFLENSNYPLERYPEFADSPRLRVHRFPPSGNPEKGKGFQEFEMLDKWVLTEPKPPRRWLKLTGRYDLLNMSAILKECGSEQKYSLLIDQLRKQKMARTYMFCIQTEFYRTHLANLYRQCDDRTGEWIERVLFRKLETIPAGQIRLFKTQPLLRARAGSTGLAFPSGKFQWSIKQNLRRLNQLMDERYLHYIP
ncbi:MAG: hypothetical protein WCI95_00710 [bacterium]